MLFPLPYPTLPSRKAQVLLLLLLWWRYSILILDRMFAPTVVLRAPRKGHQAVASSGWKSWHGAVADWLRSSALPVSRGPPWGNYIISRAARSANTKRRRRRNPDSWCCDSSRSYWISKQIFVDTTFVLGRILRVGSPQRLSRTKPSFHIFTYNSGSFNIMSIDPFHVLVLVCSSDSKIEIGVYKTRDLRIETTWT